LKIVCLHTAESNISVFETAAKELNLPDGVLSHAVRRDLLERAEQAGGLTPQIAYQTALVLRSLAKGADAVLLTCSTLGPSISDVGDGVHVPILRVDATLAKQATGFGGLVIALCAVETTIEPTTRLFAEASASSLTRCEVRLVRGAWALFKAGDRDSYLSAIAEAADAAYRDGAKIVALAQASMAGAAALVKHGPKPLSSPVAGLAAAIDLISRKS
jgi:hypothetical protein